MFLSPIWHIILWNQKRAQKIMDGFKKTTKYLGKPIEIKDKMHTATESFTEHLEEIKDHSREYLELQKVLHQISLVHQEIIRNIPLGGWFSFPLGSFYFFQHSKYITK